MKTLRLLLWLRWTTFSRATSTGNRVAAVLLNLLFALMFSPLWLGGAVGAYLGVRHYGAPVVVVAFGLCQLGWLYFGMLSGALGRSFDLDRWLRWPVRPRLVYAFNILATLIEPTCLMTFPTLGAVALACGSRGGAPAALAALAGGLLLTLLTASLLQLLLATLDELLRREWVRFVALSLLPLTFLGIQFSMRRYAAELAQRVLHGSLSPERAVAFGSSFFSRVPTVGAPAALATGVLAGAPLRAALGLLAALALLALAVWPGAALMRRTARAGESAGGAAGGAKRATRGSFAAPLPGVSRAVALLFARELRATFQIPQRLVSTVQTPLLILVIAFVNGRMTPINPVMILAILTSTVSTASLLQFSYDGPGVRTYFLLPIRPRDVLLAKNLEFMVRLLFQFAIVFAGFAAAIAHEIRNPLTSIAGSVSMLSDVPALSQEERHLLDIVTRESERLNNIITDFLAYSRGKQYRFERVSLAPLLEDTLTLLEHRLTAEGAGMRVERSLPKGEALVLADGDKLKQVFWNFCENAVRAMKKTGGTLTVSLTERGPDWEMSFTDTGPGISPQQSERLFEPFQSNFEGGTGLGLAIVYQIVQAHEGKVWARSEVGKGTSFVLRLRRLDEPATALPSGTSKSAATKSAEKSLATSGGGTSG